MRDVLFVPLLEASKSVTDELLEIRNIESIRNVMYSSHIISVEEHSNWIESLKGNEAQVVWVVFYRGVVAGDVSLSNINYVHRTADWAFSVRPELQGIGLGASVEYRLLDIAFSEFGIEKLNCEVLSSNDKVARFHQKFGFRIEGVRRSNILKHGVRLDVILLGMARDEWLDFEPNLRKYK